MREHECPSDDRIELGEICLVCWDDLQAMTGRMADERQKARESDDRIFPVTVRQMDPAERRAISTKTRKWAQARLTEPIMLDITDDQQD